jgi:hypothetical protein
MAMHPRHILYTPFVAVLLLVTIAVAQIAVAQTAVAQTATAPPQSVATESGWLKLVKGARDSVLGARLVNIEDDESTDTQKLTLAIPKKSLANREDIEEVVVVGQQPEHPERTIPIEFTYEWVNDYDNDNYGLVVHLGKNSNWPIRLYLSSEAGFTR